MDNTEKALRELQRAFYKYAKVDFDRLESIDNIRFLFGILEEDGVSKILEELPDFISQNEERIVRIFKINKVRFNEILLLSQPEVILIWFYLLKYERELKDAWEDAFLLDELEVLENLWG